MTRRSGDWRQSEAIPSSLKGSPRRAIRSYSGPESVFAHALTWFVVPPSLTAAAKRPGTAPISQLTMNPPYESPMIPSRAGSANPRSTTWSIAARTSSASTPPKSPSWGVIHAFP